MKINSENKKEKSNGNQRKYPNKEEASRYITDEVAIQLGYDNLEALTDCYNDYGSFILDKFINFNDKFFEETEDISEFAKNYKDEKGRVKGGCALLSLETIADGSSEGGSKYEGKFDTAHVLAYMLVGSVPDFDSSKKNGNNIFSQTSWANGGDVEFISSKINTERGNSQFTYEKRIHNKINKKKMNFEDFRVYYQVDLIYNGDEEVPRGIHIQAISNDKTQKLGEKSSDLNVFITNVRYGENTEINYSEWKENTIDPKYLSKIKGEKQ